MEKDELGQETEARALARFLVGQLVWGKVKGFPWWPCKIIAVDDAAALKKVKKPSASALPVYYFGSNNFGWLAEEDIKDYKSYYNEFKDAGHTKQFQTAVKQAAHADDFILPLCVADRDDVKETKNQNKRKSSPRTKSQHSSQEEEDDDDEAEGVDSATSSADDANGDAAADESDHPGNSPSDDEAVYQAKSVKRKRSVGIKREAKQKASSAKVVKSKALEKTDASQNEPVKSTSTLNNGDIAISTQLMHQERLMNYRRTLQSICLAEPPKTEKFDVAEQVLSKLLDNKSNDIQLISSSKLGVVVNRIGKRANVLPSNLSGKAKDLCVRWKQELDRIVTNVSEETP